ncbi:MAG: hypothetical protein QOH57_203 [Mycobacterium sp.]|nr:hypothetical protein [Mycobacterium sp.]
MNDRIVNTVSEGEELFAEVKKFLVLSVSQKDMTVGMSSARVDEAWHTFLLYTDQYSAFCQEYFGRFVGHAPKNAPAAEAKKNHSRTESTFAGFRERYETVFAEPLPDVWYDVRNIFPAQRMFNDRFGRKRVIRRDSAVEVLDEDGEAILSVNELAGDAIDFIARTGAFYVRELPGDLTDEEKVALVEALVSVGALRLAP